MELQQYWKVIQKEVCTRCIDGDERSNCHSDPSIECPVQKYLPAAIDVVTRLEKSSMADYVNEVHTIICSRCKYQTVNGYCILKSTVDCALDQYFPLIIKAIEGIHEKSIIE